MSIIQAYATRYEKVSYYDSEFVIKGVLRIDTREYGFTHYDGAFAFSRLKIKAGKVKPSTTRKTAFRCSRGEILQKATFCIRIKRRLWSI